MKTLDSINKQIQRSEKNTESLIIEKIKKSHEIFKIGDVVKVDKSKINNFINVGKSIGTPSIVYNSYKIYGHIKQIDLMVVVFQGITSISLCYYDEETKTTHLGDYYIDAYLPRYTIVGDYERFLENTDLKVDKTIPIRWDGIAAFDHKYVTDFRYFR